MPSCVGTGAAEQNRLKASLRVVIIPCTALLILKAKGTSVCEQRYWDLTLCNGLWGGMLVVFPLGRGVKALHFSVYLHPYTENSTAQAEGRSSLYVLISGMPFPWRTGDASSLPV